MNGVPVETLGVQVRPGKDVVTVDGHTVELFEREVYIVLNKPKDCITTLSDERGRTTVLDFVHVKQRVFPVGRLDRNTTGVLLLTNDGKLSHALLHPKGEVERMYKVTLSENVREADIRDFRKGIRLDDGIARAKEIGRVDKKKVILTMVEGRNREVRRMFEAKEYDVKQLDRISYGGITASGLPRGTWRFLSRDEIKHLRSLSGIADRTDVKATLAKRRKRA